MAGAPSHKKGIPPFLMGFLRTFDVFHIIKPDEEDADRLRERLNKRPDEGFKADWENIGKDFRSSVKQFKKRHSAR